MGGTPQKKCEALCVLWLFVFVCLFVCVWIFDEFETTYKPTLNVWD